jgi:hypothetical protein
MLPDTRNVDKVFDDYTTKDWYELINKTLHELYPENKNIENFEISQTGKFQGGKCWLNPEVEGKIVNNVVSLSFIRCYPHTICKLYIKGELTFNNDKIGDLFCNLVDITKDDIKKFIEDYRGCGTLHMYYYLMGVRDEIPEVDGLDSSIIDIIKRKKEEEASEKLEIYLLKWLKMTMNRFYGILASTRSDTADKSFRYECNDIGLVTEFIRNFWDIIIDNFESNICYIDTDSIWFKQDGDFNIEKVKEVFNFTELPYERDWMMKNISGTLFENIINAKLPEDTISQIINEDRNVKLKSILNEPEKLPENDTYICLFLRKKSYLIFNSRFELISMFGIRSYNPKTKMKSISNKINSGYKFKQNTNISI